MWLKSLFMDMAFCIRIAGVSASCPMKEYISPCWNIIVFLLYIREFYFLRVFVWRCVRKKEKDQRPSVLTPLISTTIELLVRNGANVSFCIFIVSLPVLTLVPNCGSSQLGSHSSFRISVPSFFWKGTADHWSSWAGFVAGEQPAAGVPDPGRLGFAEAREGRWGPPDLTQGPAALCVSAATPGVCSRRCTL